MKGGDCSICSSIVPREAWHEQYVVWYGDTIDPRTFLFVMEAGQTPKTCPKTI